jgi:UDP-N-acetylmuramoylalanine--D-glutamate ligase
VFWFSRRREVEQGSFVGSGQIVFRDGSNETAVMPADDMTLKGAHNLENVLAAVTIGMIANIEPAKIRRAVHEFKAVEHRLEYVATINGAQSKRSSPLPATFT